MRCIVCQGPAVERVTVGPVPIGYMCMADLDEFMYRLSLTVPPDEGRAGYQSFRVEKGLPWPDRWPEREPLP